MVWHLAYITILCFKKFYRTCVKTSASLLMRSIVHKKSAYMLPVQVLWGMSSKMSTVQTATLTGEIFSHLSRHACGMFSAASITFKSSGTSSQSLDPHLPDGNFLFDFYVWEQSLRATLILTSGFVWVVNVKCAAWSVSFKTLLHHNWYSPPSLFSHQAPFMYLE